ncbi:unnamed protein product [Orchesella dallaii]|uniref:BTB domain-containing protein n=1 Tax=Orchesella dallaii TaxID=48710 RepID=A0ABP1QZ10_9HEXA
MEEQNESNFDAGSNGEDAEMYLLKWNSHQNHFANKFSELLDEDEIAFTDVTLACEGQFLQAHRLVLSVCSPFFKNLFKVNSAERGPATVVLANVRYTDLENILHFIYRGQVNVRKEDLNKFLETGEQLQIDGLVGQGQSKNSFKRRFSDGGQVVSRNQGSGSYLVNKTGTASRSSFHGQYKTVTTSGNANASRLASAVTHNNHSHDSIAKKPRISPTSSVARSNHETGTNNSARRASTSAHHNNANSPSSVTADVVSGMETESGAAENSGIKILSVATVNAGYDGQHNDVIEILDYEDDDRADNEVDELYSIVEGADDGGYYGYQSSYQRTHASNQQSRHTDSSFRNTLQARYPSIIDGVHFELISADEKRVAAQCKLCPGEKVIRGSGLTSSNFISHLRAFHKRELEEWREKRKTETTRRRQDI